MKKVEKTTKIFLTKEKNFNEAKVKFSSETALFLKSKPEFLPKFRFSQTSYQSKYTDEGFAFNRVKTQFLGFENDVPKVEISVLKVIKKSNQWFCFARINQSSKTFYQKFRKEFVGKNV